MKFSGVLGGINSQLGQVALGYDPQDEVIVWWVANSSEDNYTSEMEFGFDESGRPIVLKLGVLTNLPKVFARKAQSDGAVIHSEGSLT